MKQDLYTIQEVSALLGVSPKTLRRWEERGMILPIRTAGNQRRYRIEEIKKLERRRRLKEIRREIKEEFSTSLPVSQPILSQVLSDPAPQAMPVVDPLPAINSVQTPTFSPKRFIKPLASGIFAVLFLIGSATVWQLLGYPGLHPGVKSLQSKSNENAVLGSSSSTPAYQLNVNVPGIFGKQVTFLNSVNIEKGLTVKGLSELTGGIKTNNKNINAGTGRLTASNVIYSIVAGSNITISGNKQNPVISAGTTGVSSLQGTTGAVTLAQGSGISLNGLTINNTGVLSVQGTTGDVTFNAGNGINISGTTITNSDTGSAQNIFKTFDISGTDINASNNNDTINFAAGSGISLTGNTGSKTITITSNSSGTLSGLTTNGVLYATNSTNATSTAPGTTGTVLHGITNGAPVFSAVNLTADVSNILPIGNGGTGVGTTPTNGEILIGNGSGYSLATIAQGSGIGVANGSGTITLTNNGVVSLTGTANQVSVSGSTGAVVLSLPQDIDNGASPTFTALNLTATSNQLILGTTNTATITTAALTGNRTYTFPDGSGTVCILELNNCGGGGGGDIGGGGTQNYIPLFTSSTAIGDSSIYDSSGNIGIGTTSPQGLFSVSGGVTGQALVSLNNTAIDQNILVGSASGTTRFVFDSNGDLNIIGGGYQIGGTNVLSSTALGTSVVSSSLTSVGALNTGSIASGFGTIDTGGNSISGGDITSTGATGFTSSGAGAGITFNSTGNHIISASSGTLELGTTTLTGDITGNSKNLTGLNNLSAAGTITFSTFTTNNGLLYTNGAGQLAQSNAGTTGQVLLSNSGTPTFTTLSGDIASVTGAGVVTLKSVGPGAGSLGTTASQTPVITVDAQGRVVSVSNTSIAIAASQIASGQLAAANGGTGADLSGAAQYSIPYFSAAGVLGGALPPGTAGYVLTTNNTGSAPSWTNAASLGTNYWQLLTGAISPMNETNDLLLGSTATTSAKFAFENVASGVPTASISANTANNSTYITGDGTLATTDKQSLTLGSASTGSIILGNGLSTGIAHISASGVLSSSLVSLTSDVTGLLPVGNGGTGAGSFTSGGVLYGNGTGALGVSTQGTTGQVLLSGGSGSPTWTTGTLSLAGNFSVSGANALTLTTTASTNVTLPTTGTLATLAGSEALTNKTVNGLSLQANADGFQISGGTTPRTLTVTSNNVTLNQNLSTSSSPSFTGLTVSGFTAGVVQSSGVGLLSSSALNLATAGNVTGLLPLANGGTNADLSSSVSNGGIVYSTSSNLAILGANAHSGLALVSGGAGTPSWFAPTQGSLIFAGANGALSQNNPELFFDNTNDLLGIGTSSPTAPLQVNGAYGGNAAAIINQLNSGNILSASVSGATEFNVTNNGSIQFNGGSGFLQTLTSNAAAGKTYNLPTFTGSSADICLTTGNCAGAGGGVTGSGTATQLAFFTGANAISSDSTLYFDNVNKLLGIGTGTPTAPLQVNGAYGGNAAAIINQLNSGNIFTASASGATEFNVTNNGSIQFNGGSGFLQTLTSNAAAGKTYNLPTFTGSSADICLTTGNCAGAGGGITGSGTATQLAFFTGANAISSDSTLYFDNVKKLLGIGTGTPTAPLQVNGAYGGNAAEIVNQLNSGNIFTASASGTTAFTIQNNGNLAATGTITGLTGITSSGTIDFSGLGTGIVQSATGTLSSSAINLGTIGSSYITGTLGVGNGGTGVASFGGTNTLLYTTSANTLSDIATVNNAALVTNGSGVPGWISATANQVLRADGSGNVGFGSIDLSQSGTVGSSILNVANGGTGLASVTSGDLLYGNGTGALTALPISGTGGECLTSNGSVPGWQTCPGSSTQNYWQLNNGALSPFSTTADLLLGGTATTSAKFAFINNDAGSPTASISGNLSLVTPLGANPAATFNVLNGGSLNFQTSVGGDAGLNSALYIANNGNIGIGSTNPTTNLFINATNNSTSSNIATLNSPANFTGDWVNLEENGSPTLEIKSIFNNPNYEPELYFSGGSVTGQAINFGNQYGTFRIVPTNSVGTYFESTQNNMLFTGGNGVKGTVLDFDYGQNEFDGNIGIGLKPFSGDGALAISFPNNPPSFSSADGNLQLGYSSSGNYTWLQSYVVNNPFVINPLGNGVGVGTTAVGNGELVVNQPNSSGSIFSASSSGTTAFTIVNNGNLAATGTITGLTGITSSGTIDFSTLSSGVVQSASGTLSASNLNLATGPVTGILSIANGGTDTNSIGTDGEVAYSNGTNYAFTTVGSSGQVLESNGAAAPTWVSASALNYWQLVNGALSPLNETNDLLLGSTATTSAKFAFENVAGGIPTASISANSGNNATYLSGTGVLGTTNAQTLTLGSASTGNVVLAPGGTTTLTAISSGKVGIGTTSPTSTLQVNGTTEVGFTNSAGAFGVSNAGGNTEFNVDTSANGVYIQLPQNASSGTTTVNGVSLNLASAYWNGSTNVESNYTLQNIASTTGSNYRLAFLNNNSQEKMTLDENGNLGIGTTTPIAPLQINGAYGSNGAFIVNQNNNGDLIDASASGSTIFQLSNTGNLELQGSSAALQLVSRGGGGSMFLYSDTGGDLDFYSNTQNVAQMLNNGALSLGVGISPTNNMLDVGGSSAFGTYGTNNTAAPTNGLLVSGNVGIGPNFGTVAPKATLDVRGNSATTPVASVSGSSNFANFVVDQSGSGDLFTASASGATKFTILNNGNLSLNNYNSCGMLTTVGTVLTCSSAPTGTNYWQLNNGALAPLNITNDLLLGGTSTTSARFAFTNNTGSGTPTASISANSGNNATYLTGAGVLGTTNAQTLTLGSSSTGNVNINPGGSNVASFSTANNGTFQVNDINDGGNLFKVNSVYPFATFPRTIFQGGQSTGDTDWFMRFADAYSSSSNPITAGFQLTDTNDPNYTNTESLNVEQTSTLGLFQDSEGPSSNGTPIEFTTNGSSLAVPNLYLDTVANSYRVGIGTTSPLAQLDVRNQSATTPIASLSGATTNAGLVVDNGIGDLFTASSSGLSRFTIQQNGNILLGQNGVASPNPVTISGAQAAGSNEVGGNLTLAASNGTGTGGSGSLNFQVASASASSPTFDTQAAADTNSVSSVTWNHTVGNGGNRLLVVGFTLDSSKTVSSVTYGSQSLTKLQSQTFGSGSSKDNEIWYLVAPNQGTYQIKATFSGSADVRAGSEDFYNVNQSSPFGTVTANNNGGTNSASPSVTPNSGSNQLVIDHLGVDSGGGNINNSGTSQIIIWDNGNGSGLSDAASTQPSAGSTTSMTWTLSGSTGWSDIGVALQPVTATTADGYQNALTILSNGNVGIGTQNPTANLSVAGSISNLMGGATTLTQVASNSAGLSTSPNNIAIQGKYAYMTDGSGRLVIYDLTNPASPQEVGNLTSGVGFVNHIVVQGKYAYIADAGGSMVIVDVSNPASPVRVSDTTAGLTNATGIAVQGKYAYVTDWNNADLVIFDVSNPANPTEIASTTGGGVIGLGSDVSVQGKYAYVIGWGGVLVIFDISNPYAPKTLGDVSGGSTQNDITVSGDYAYVADFQQGLIVYNISNPNSPTFVTHTDSGLNDASGVAVAGRYAYVTDDEYNTLNVYDVLNPASPTWVANSEIGSPLSVPQEPVIYGNYAYVGAYGPAEGTTSPGALLTFSIGGIETTSILAHAAELGSLNVDTNAEIGNQLNVEGGLNVGTGGIYTQGTIAGGNLSINGLFGTTPNASISGATSFAGLLVDNSGSGDLFTASKSGATKFVITNAGNVGIGTATPTKQLTVNGTVETMPGGGLQLDANDHSGNNFSLTSATGGLDFYGPTVEVATLTGGGGQLGLGINNTVPAAQLDVLPTDFTLPGGYIHGSTGKATLELNQTSNVGDLFTASQSGTPKFTITNAGGIELGTNQGTSSQCLESGGSSAAAVWATCAAGTNYWQLNSNALSPANSTYDLLLGGTATTSAKFAFTGNAGGTPTASISAGTTGATYLNATGTLGTTNAQTLTLGSATTGNVLVTSGGAGTVAIQTTAQSGATGSINIQTGNSSTATPGNVTIDTGTGVVSGATVDINGIPVDNFEGSGTGSIDDWSNSSGETISASTTQAHSGSYSLKISETNAFWAVSEACCSKVPVTPGHQYIISFWVRGGNASETMTSNVWWEGGPDNNTETSLPNVTDTTTGWTEMTGEVTAPVGAQYFHIDLSDWGGGTNGFATYLDDYTVTDVSNVVAPAVNIGTTNAEAVTIGNSNQAGLTSLLGGGDGILELAGNYGAVNIGTSNNNNVTIGNSGGGIVNLQGQVGIGNGNTSPLSVLDVRAESGTLAVASISGNTSLANLVVDQSGSGDLFTASKSGATKFVIQNNGNIGFAGTNSVLSTLASAATSVQTWTLPNASGTICVSGQTCASSGTVGYFQRNNGALAPANITDDLLLGGTATTSAKFAFTGNAGGSTPTASISAGTTGATYLNATGTLATTNGQTLQLGNGTTGQVQIGETPAAAFGNTRIGTMGGSDNNLITGQQFTTPLGVGGTVTSMSVYVRTAVTGGSKIQMGIYSNTTSGCALSASNCPGSLIASTAQVTPTGTSWNTAAISATLSPNTTYWLAYWTNDATQSFEALVNPSSAGNYFVDATQSFGGSMPSTFPAIGFNNNTYDASIYASFSGNSGPAMTIDPNTGNITLGYNEGLNTVGPSSYISNTQGYTDSEVFGANAQTFGQNAVVVGEGAEAATNNSVAIGMGSITNGGVAIGYGAQANGGTGGGIAIGYLSQANNTLAEAIGQSADAAFAESIALGYSATTTAGNQLVVGGSQSSGGYITDTYLGSGVTDATPQNTTIHATGGNGSNIAGASLTLAGGAATGNAAGGSILFKTSTAGTSGSTLQSLTTRMSIDNNGNVGIGTTNALATFDVRGNSGTTPIASISGNTAFANTIIDQSGSGDLFTASKSGATKFTITNAGNIIAPNYNGNNAVLYGASGTGAITAVATTSTGGQCLLSGASSAAPTWGSCDAGNTSWVQANGTIYEGNTTEDLLLGGTATTSAKFAFTGNAGGTPTASISAGTTGATYLNATGTLGTTNAQTLTLGASSTGNIAFTPNGNSILTLQSFSNGGYFEPEFYAAGGNAGGQAIDFGNANGSFRIVPWNDGNTYFQATQNNMVFSGGNGSEGTNNEFNFKYNEMVGNLGIGVLPGINDGALSIGISNGPPSFAQADGDVQLGYSTGSTYGWLQSYNNSPFALNPLGYGVGVGTSAIGNGELVVNQPNSGGNIFSASSSGSTVFNIANNGNLNVGGNSTSTSDFAVENVTGGQGALTSFANNTNSLPTGLTTGAAVTANGYVYYLGGTTGGWNTGNVVSTVYYAQILGNGTLGPFLTTTSLPVAMSAENATVYNGYMYILGGWNNSGSSPYETVYYAPINSNGTLGAWNQTASIPDATPYTADASVDIANGYIYFLGGQNGSGATNTSNTYYAPINANGTVGSWTASATLPNSRSYGSSVIANGYIYYFDGLNSSSAAVNTVYYAKLNPANGAIGTWIGTTSTSGNLGGQMSTVNNGYVYLMGGSNVNASGHGQTAIYYASLNPNGQIGSWNTATSQLTQVTENASAITANGYIYVLGGDNDISTVYSTVESASTARVQIEGDLDLLGLEGGTVASSSGSMGGQGSVGGSIYAGDIYSNGSLEVAGNSEFWNGLGITGNTSINGNLNLAGTSGTTPTASISGNTSFAGLLVDNSGSGDLFTASKSGATKFVIQNNGDIETSNGSSLVAGVTNIGLSCASVVNGIVTGTGSCALGNQYWQMPNSGAIAPFSTTADLLVGGTATTSAKFAFTGVDGGTPTASISAGTTGATYLNATGTLGTTNAQTLTIGTASTGNIAFNPDNIGVGNSLFLANGDVGIGTSTPDTILSLGQNNNQVVKLAVYDNSNTNLYGIGEGGGNLTFGAGVAYNGTAQMVLNESGDVGIGTQTPNALLQVAGTASISGELALTSTPQIQSTANQTLILGGNTTGDIAFQPGGQAIGNSLYLGSNGEVGIDTSGPEGALGVNGTEVLITNSSQALKVESTGSLVALDADTQNGRVGIGTTAPVDALDVRASSGTTGIASISGQTSFAGLVVDNSGSGDLFTASSSGLSRFTVQQNGNILLGQNGVASANNVTISGAQTAGSNEAGGNLTLAASNGTGTGGSGSLNFQVASSSTAAPQFDTEATANTVSGGASSLSWKHTVGAGSNRILIVGVTMTGSKTVSSVTYGGQSLTKEASRTYDTSSSEDDEMWYLLNPTQGTATVTVTASSGTPVIVAGSEDFYNVNQTQPFNSSSPNVNFGTGGTSSDTVTSGANELVIDHVAVDVSGSNININGSGQTATWLDNSVSNTSDGASYKASSGSTTSMTWSFVNTPAWADVGVALMPVTATTNDGYENALTITSNGNVGIGTSTPTANLSVAGSISNLTSGVDNPTLVASTSAGLSTKPSTVAIQGKYAYVTDENSNKLITYDITNPSSPQEIGTLSGVSGFITVQGRYAYIVPDGGSTLSIIDISNPASPTVVGSTSSGFSGFLSGVAVQGKYAYVADYNNEDLEILDVSNPAHPFEVTTVSTGGIAATSVAAQGRYVYVLTWGGALYIFDMSNPYAPVQVGSVDNGSESQNMAVSGNYAYVTDLQQGLIIYDISNPASPTLESKTFSGLYNPNYVTVSGRYAYVTDNVLNTLNVFDVSSPTSPSWVGSSAIGSSLSNPGQPVISGQDFYLPTYGTGSANGAMLVYNIGGIETTAIMAHSAEVGTLNVDQSEEIDNDLSIGGGVNVGAGGIYSSGAIAGANLNINGTVGTTPNASVSGKTSFAGFVVDNSGSGDIFTASSSGLSRFTVQQNGNILLGQNGVTNPNNISISGQQAGGSNTNGGNLTINAQNGTGASGSGSIIFQTAAPTANTITLDNAASSSIATNSGTMSFMYNTGSHPNSIMIVSVLTSTNNTNWKVNSVRYGSQALTKVPSGQIMNSTGSGTGADGDMDLEEWYLLNPTSGNAAVYINTASYPGSAAWAAGVATYYNVVQAAPSGVITNDTPGFNTTNITTNVTGLSANQLLLDNFAVADNSSGSSCNASAAVASVSAETQLFNPQGASEGCTPGTGKVLAMASKPVNGQATNTIWNAGGFNNQLIWTDIVIPLNPTSNTPSASDTLNPALTIQNGGVVVIGNNTNGITFDPTGETGYLYSGTARPTRQIVLSAEYPGAVLTASNSASTNGFMTATASQSATPNTFNYENYYQWTSNQSSLNDYTVAVTVTLPKDFSGWPSGGNAMTIDYNTALTTSADNALDVYIYNKGDTTGIPVYFSTNNTSSAQKTWTTVNITGAQLTGSSSLNTAGQQAVIYLKMHAMNTVNYVQIGDIKLNYLSAF